MAILKVFDNINPDNVCFVDADTLLIITPCVFFKSGNANLIICIALLKISSLSSDQSSSYNCSKLALLGPPVLLTTMSIMPNFLRVLANRSSISDVLVKSATTYDNCSPYVIGCNSLYAKRKFSKL